jgi:hypothetical protein
MHFCNFLSYTVTNPDYVIDTFLIWNFTEYGKTPFLKNVRITGITKHKKHKNVTREQLKWKSTNTNPWNMGYLLHIKTGMYVFAQAFTYINRPLQCLPVYVVRVGCHNFLKNDVVSYSRKLQIVNITDTPFPSML